jgi:hypothetical protein
MDTCRPPKGSKADHPPIEPLPGLAQYWVDSMCLAVIGVFLGVGELLGQDHTPTGKLAAEYNVHLLSVLVR